MIIEEEMGRSFWSPEPTGGYITIKLDKNIVAHTNQMIFEQCIPPGKKVPAHCHLNQTEIFIHLSGEGRFLINGKLHKFTKGAIAYVDAKITHEIESIGSEPLRYLAIITPPVGLEERFEARGKPRNHNDIAPEPFLSLAPFESHDVKLPQ